jgi:enoyl-[acyl-carrier-protein] reductase (NADH)
MGRFGEIEELANLMILLLSDASDYITGATIPIDGGHHLAAPSTFAGMTSLTDEDWAEIRRTSQAASAAGKAGRAV